MYASSRRDSGELGDLALPAKDYLASFGRAAGMRWTQWPRERVARVTGMYNSHVMYTMNMAGLPTVTPVGRRRDFKCGTGRQHCRHRRPLPAASGIPTQRTCLRGPISHYLMSCAAAELSWFKRAALPARKRAMAIDVASGTTG
jgi:hypothetical protein